jgi:hypothetical protein
VKSRDRAAFARAARFWRNELGYLELSNLDRALSIESYRVTAWSSKNPWPEHVEVAEVAESLSLDGVSVRG